jgi:hypothetical protein
MNSFKIKFAKSEVRELILSYKIHPLEDSIEKNIVPRTRELGYVTRGDFLTLCSWKTTRTEGHCTKNSEEFIKSVSQIALSTADEQIRIEIWTLLNGVGWPTASVFLCWLHAKEYPILDYRALWSLSWDKPPKYNFSFWNDYVKYCRDYAGRYGVSVRDLDRALWQYSKENQLS